MDLYNINRAFNAVQEDRLEYMFTVVFNRQYSDGKWYKMVCKFYYNSYGQMKYEIEELYDEPLTNGDKTKLEMLKAEYAPVMKKICKFIISGGINYSKEAFERKLGYYFDRYDLIYHD